LWKDEGKKKEAAEALKLTAQDAMALGVIHDVIQEPPGGAHRDPDSAIEAVAMAVERNLRELLLMGGRGEGEEKEGDIQEDGSGGAGKRRVTMNLLAMIVRIPAILLALTVHEYAHARIASAMGDPTARLRGRMTLNPLSHIDPLGFLCLMLAGFGWAKPVPINPFYFSEPRKGMMWSSFAGPHGQLSRCLRNWTGLQIHGPPRGAPS
jgi:hypothetical protein